jgi:hypothetical protein
MFLEGAVSFTSFCWILIIMNSFDCIGEVTTSERNDDDLDLVTMLFFSFVVFRIWSLNIYSGRGTPVAEAFVFFRSFFPDLGELLKIV